MPSGWNDRVIPVPSGAGDGPVQGGATGPGDGQVELTDEQMERWAQLLADGEVEFPEALPAHQAEALVAEVRRLRRKSLIRFIARQIARHIKRDLESGAMQESKDD